MIYDFNVSKENKVKMWDLAEKLEPIYRTLVSPGFEKSLEVINDYFPLNIKKYPTGQSVFDWIIPQSWTPIAGYLEDMNGNRLIDFEDEPFFIGPYSEPVDGIFNRKELFKHTATLPHLKDAVPLCPVYYDNNWRIGLPHSLKEQLTDDAYKVHIDSESVSGHLAIGEVYLPGTSEKEIVFSTYLCHPHEANDNISGVVVSVELFKILAQMEERFYSYRLIIIPETIGSITFLYHHQEEMRKVIGGYAITCCGDSGPISFKKSWKGDSLLDKIGIKVANDTGVPYNLIAYDPTGSDERQFNAPGFRIPMPTIMRTPPGSYPEYHSSFDNLSILDADKLGESLQFILDNLYILDNNSTYKNNYKTEPFLSKYGIHKQVHDAKFGVFNKQNEGIDQGLLNQIIMSETDGKQDLFSIAEKFRLPFEQLKRGVEVFEKAGLVRKVTERI